jgi:hypothetical protein
MNGSGPVDLGSTIQVKNLRKLPGFNALALAWSHIPLPHTAALWWAFTRRPATILRRECYGCWPWDRCVERGYRSQRWLTFGQAQGSSRANNVDARSVYVTISRTRNGAAVFTDNRASLTKSLGFRDGAQAGAIDETMKVSEVGPTAILVPCPFPSGPWGRRPGEIHTFTFPNF